MKLIIVSILLILCLLCLSACGQSNMLNVSGTVEKKAEQDSIEQITSNAVTQGTAEYRNFSLNNVLHSNATGDINYNLYIPEHYNGNEPYALYITLPGYQGLYFQGIGENIKTETFGFEAQKYNEKMLIVAPQLEDWGETSANKTIELAEYFLQNYNIDADKVYISGYSGGGETLSLVMEKKPELFAACLICSFKWNGRFDNVVKHQIPIYFVIGETDEYYGSEPFIEAYSALHHLYEQQGLSYEVIDKLLVLDVKNKDYFKSKGITNQHGQGAALFAADEQIMSWLFNN